ncbi:MAG: hypothetical protein DWQ36_12715 [Acidobacteria bacterium]|nr:MAG: hypothetical protein DWQ30_08825 [Acidobacteriota bacterium]REK07191.1 MAG: hypothetical protein DWQ36_12715 [Acidobacteriota bacterium]
MTTSTTDNTSSASGLRQRTAATTLDRQYGGARRRSRRGIRSQRRAGGWLPTLACVLLGGWLGAPPLAAEVLVLLSGERIETRGEWQQRGGRVVYTAADGALLSIRASEVDFDATEAALESAGDAATAEATASAAPGSAATAKKPVVIAITNRDVGGAARTARPGSPEGAGGAETAEGEGGSSATSPADGRERHLLAVTEWREGLSDGSGLVVEGTLANQGQSTAVNVRVTAELLDADRSAVDIATTSLTGVRLEPGDQADFSVRFPNIVNFDTVRFDISSLPLQRPVSSDGGSEAGAAGDGGAATDPPPR